MATGVLVVGIERATKILGLLTASQKSYAATIRLGQSTSTEDAEGEVLETTPAGHITDSQIAAAIAGLRGDIAQVPSTVSAIKVAGKRSYQLAREGYAVELPARPVHIARFELLALRRDESFVDLDVEVDCSAGTYIRALARDVGNELGVGGHLTALRRTRAGSFGLDQARTLDDLGESAALSYSLDDACLQTFPRRDLSVEEAIDVSHGRPLAPAGIDGIYAATDADGQVIALLEDSGRRTKSVVVIRPATL